MNRPPPLPAFDRSQIEALNTRYHLHFEGPPAPGWRGRLIWSVRRLLFRLIRPMLEPQVQFNAAVVDHLNRMDKKGLELQAAGEGIIGWVQDQFAEVEVTEDDVRRHREAMLAREQRAAVTIQVLTAAHEELKASVGLLQVTAQSLRREVERAATAQAAALPSPVAEGPPPALSMPVASGHGMVRDAYVGFEAAFRGAPEEVSQKQAVYVPLFAGRDNVLDVGCGRGEFVALLREHGVRARGIDLNRAMVDLCVEQGLDVVEADALAFLSAQPDGSLGGLIAAQVVEHLEPAYLRALLDAAFLKLRPGSPIVLETINPACWYAFFESYLRDVTHARALHPDTLKHMVLAGGFHPVEVQYLAPYPEADKLQPVTTAPNTPLSDLAETLNANVDKVNRLLFTWLDYAVIGRRP